MQIRRLLSVFLFVTLALASIVTGLAVVLRSTEIEVERAQSRRYSSHELAQELHQSSDDLTRFARTFAATGDQRFERFYGKVLDIRNGVTVRPKGYDQVFWDLVVMNLLPEPSSDSDGAVSLESRMKAAGFTIDEFSKLKEAQNRSDALVRLEEVAMNAVKGRFDDGTGNFTREGPPDRDMALKILYSQRYYDSKAQIMRPIGEFLVMVDQRTKAELAALNHFSREILLTILVTSAAMLAGIASMVWMLKAKLLRPSEVLLSAVREIAGGNLAVRTNLTGRNEISELGQAIDSMAGNLADASLKAQQKTAEAEAQARALTEERHQTEKLLHNILPAMIADRLQKGESMIAETFPEVTVLFADIVGFTALSAKLGPNAIVLMLNDVFGRFDELARRHKLEKIKTIGDCYMVVGGIPDRSPTHCQQIAEFALAALKSFGEYAAGFAHPLSIRIGIHTGTVVAGIVGTQKFSYDLWGDVVNTASRYESMGTPDRINVSEAVRVRLADDYEFENGGMIELKGKGPMQSWFLTGPKAGSGQVIEFAKSRKSADG
ncbi:MAG: adenylate/guanylate cyclase domain-containing protein [Alphaproteobacteria bacterium]